MDAQTFRRTRFRPGTLVGDIDTDSSRASPVTARTPRRSPPSAANASPNCRKCSTPTAGKVTIDQCCWSCRAWKPPARAASSPMSWVPAIRWGSTTTASASPPRGSSPPLPLADQQSPSARRTYRGVRTDRTTRTYWSCGCTSWCPPTRWRDADEINTFESELIESGTRIVKVTRHVRPARRTEARLTERLQRPDKFWRAQPGRRRASARCGRHTRRLLR